MFFWLLVIVPLIELYILLLIGQHLGLFYAILLVVVTGLLGMILAKQQGLAVFLKVRQQLAEGRMPGEPLLDGLLVLAGALLLLTPGILTDLVGFFFLMPFSRKMINHRLQRLILRMLGKGTIKIWLGH